MQRSTRVRWMAPIGGRWTSGQSIDPCTTGRTRSARSPVPGGMRRPDQDGSPALVTAFARVTSIHGSSELPSVRSIAAPTAGTPLHRGARGRHNAAVGHCSAGAAALARVQGVLTPPPKPSAVQRTPRVDREESNCSRSTVPRSRPLGGLVSRVTTASIGFRSTVQTCRSAHRRQSYRLKAAVDFPEGTGRPDRWSDFVGAPGCGTAGPRHHPSLQGRQPSGVRRNDSTSPRHRENLRPGGYLCLNSDITRCGGIYAQEELRLRQGEGRALLVAVRREGFDLPVAL